MHKPRDKVTSSHWNHHHDFQQLLREVGLQFYIFLRVEEAEEEIGVSANFRCTFEMVFGVVLRRGSSENARE